MVGKLDVGRIRVEGSLEELAKNGLEILEKLSALPAQLYNIRNKDGSERVLTASYLKSNDCGTLRPQIDLSPFEGIKSFSVPEGAKVNFMKYDEDGETIQFELGGKTYHMVVPYSMMMGNNSSNKD